MINSILPTNFCTAPALLMAAAPALLLAAAAADQSLLRSPHSSREASLIGGVRGAAEGGSSELSSALR